MKTLIKYLWFPLLVAVICGLIYYFDKPVLWIIETVVVASVLYAIGIIVSLRRTSRQTGVTTASTPNGGDYTEPEHIWQGGETVRKIIWSLIAIWCIVGYVYFFNFVLPAKLHLYFPFAGDGTVWYAIASIVPDVLLLAYLFASFTTRDERGRLILLTVGPDEVGVVLLFDRPIVNVTSGLVFVPAFISRLITLPSGEIQKEVPDQPENLVRNEDVVTVPPGKKPVFRITFAQGNQTDADPLNQRVTQEVSGIYAFRAVNPRVFVREVRDLGNALQLLDDVFVRVLTEQLPRHTLAHVLANVGGFSTEVLRALKMRSRTWGVQMTQGAIKAIGLSHDLNKALQAPSVAVSEARATEITAEATRLRLTKEGEGRGAANKAEVAGTAAGFGLTSDGELTAAARAALAVRVAGALGDKTVILGGEGLAQALALGGAFLKGTDKTVPSGSTPTSTP